MRRDTRSILPVLEQGVETTHFVWSYTGCRCWPCRVAEGREVKVPAIQTFKPRLSTPLRLMAPVSARLSLKMLVSRQSWRLKLVILLGNCHIGKYVHVVTPSSKLPAEVENTVSLPAIVSHDISTHYGINKWFMMLRIDCLGA